MINYPFLQAKYYTAGRGGKKVSFIFLHTMETPQTVNRARQVWQWFAGKTAPQASAHFMCDNINIKQSVRLADTAWAVDDYDLNQRSVSIETSGEASQTPAQWADAYAKQELASVAKLVAQLCKQYNIPAVRIHAVDIVRGKPGIAGHWDVTLAKNIKGGHTDPGKNFPWETFITMVVENLQKL